LENGNIFYLKRKEYTEKTMPVGEEEEWQGMINDHLKLQLNGFS
jgi:hypothetical protein